MTIELKIKNKHLSEEARIIRFEEKKELKKARYQVNKLKDSGHNGDLSYEYYSHQSTYRSLNDHRRWDVRNENRATYLARAFIEGVPYKTVEQKRKEENEYTFQQFILPRVFAMVAKYDKSLSLAERRWEKNRYVATDELKQKIKEWSKLD